MLTATPTTTIRAATVDDLPRLVEMGQRFRRDSVYATRLADNGAQMAQTTANLIASPDGVCFVVEKAEGLVGMIGLLAFTHHFSGLRTVGELVFWVEPEHRGCGVRLLRRAEAWARDQHATTLQLIAPTDAVGRLYDRLGYHALEVAYEKEITPCP